MSTQPQSKKILVVTPRFPYPEAGACQQDRAEGIRQLKRLGFDVRVLTKIFDWQDPETIKQVWKNEGVVVGTVPYKYQRLSKKEKIKMALRFVFRPWLLDSSTYEYRDPELQKLLTDELEHFTPDYVWFDYTYTWPLFSFVEKKGIPVIFRSITYEVDNFLEEDGKTLFNYVKALPKMYSERKATKEADVVFAITPREQKKYQQFRKQGVFVLPLRSLHNKLGTHTPRTTDVLHIVYSGSTFSVEHNYRALKFILTELAPHVLQDLKKKYIFHITGAKFPEEFQSYLNESVRYHGFVDDLEAFLRDMDIALAPSFFGAGMQQKIFEPVSRGFPTVTHMRGLAEYPVISGEDVLTGVDADSFCKELEKLQSYESRVSLSQHAKEKSRTLFSREVIDRIVQDAMNSLKKI